MTITRNGVEYELTQEELYRAFQEQQHLNDISNIDLYLENLVEEEVFEKVKDNNEFFNNAADTLRTNLDDLGMTFDIALEKAIEDTLEDFLAYNSVLDDKLFYSIELQNGGKIIHVFGEIYYLGNGEENDYCSAQFTGAYLDFEDVQESGGKFLEYIYNDGSKVYERNVTRAEAAESIETYFSGDAGTKLDIYECDQDTPCGDYWCEI